LRWLGETRRVHRDHATELQNDKAAWQPVMDMDLDAPQPIGIIVDAGASTTDALFLSRGTT
jgi:hypothetical protein